jgi:hypothetical protein
VERGLNNITFESQTKETILMAMEEADPTVCNMKMNVF